MTENFPMVIPNLSEVNIPTRESMDMLYEKYGTVPLDLEIIYNKTRNLQPWLRDAISDKVDSRFARIETQFINRKISKKKQIRIKIHIQEFIDYYIVREQLITYWNHLYNQYGDTVRYGKDGWGRPEYFKEAIDTLSELFKKEVPNKSTFDEYIDYEAKRLMQIVKCPNILIKTRHDVHGEFTPPEGEIIDLKEEEHRKLREWSKKYRENPEIIRDIARRYYHKNKEKLLAKAKENKKEEINNGKDNRT